MLKRDFILNIVIVRLVHYYLFLQKYLLEFITKQNLVVLIIFGNSANIQFFYIKYESVQKEACEGNKSMGS